MHAPAAPFPLKESLAEELGCLLAGVAVTFALFLALSHFQHNDRPVKTPEAEDLRALTLPLEPPPPPPTLTASSSSAIPTPLSVGLEASPADSPVHIAVSPLAFDLPPSATAVPAEINIARVYPEFKPGADLSVNEQRVYQEADVDQLPRAIKRSLQFLPYSLRVNLTQIRVILVILMERSGKASSVRIVKSCGTPALDEIVARSVKEDWEFSPAIKRGKPVRCFVQQTFVIKLVPGSPLEAY